MVLLNRKPQRTLTLKTIDAQWRRLILLKSRSLIFHHCGLISLCMEHHPNGQSTWQPPPGLIKWFELSGSLFTCRMAIPEPPEQAAPSRPMLLRHRPCRSHRGSRRRQFNLVFTQTSSRLPGISTVFMVVNCIWFSLSIDHVLIVW